MEKITQHTLVPIGIVGGCLMSLIGFVVWLTTMSNTLAMYGRMFELQQTEMRELRKSQETQSEIMLKVQLELESIKTKLELLTTQRKPGR